MSYSLLVQGDRPLDYWKLNSNPTGGNFSGINFAYQAPPLTANSACALQFTYSNNASVSITNTYDIFHKNYNNKAFDIEFWFSFNNMLDGSGYLKNASSATQYFSNNSLKIIKIIDGSTEVGSINYDYDDNTFRFSIYGTSNQDAYIPVRNLNVPFYIVASYLNGKLSIFVNGETGTSGEVVTYSFLSKPSGRIVIDTTSLTSNSGPGFLVSDLAFYDYPLSMEQKRKRVVWGYTNEKPTFLTRNLGLSYFDISEKNYHTLHYEIVEGGTFNNYSYLNNLIINEDFGLMPKRIKDLELNDKSSVYASVSFSSSGARLNDYGSIVVNNFGELVGTSSPFTLTCQAISNTSNATYLFSFLDSNTNNLIYSYYDSTGLFVNSYNFETSASTNLTSLLGATTSTTTYYAGFNFNSSSLTTYWGSGGATTASSVVSVSPIKLKDSTQLEIGNCLILNSASSSSQIKNFGISDYSGNLSWNNGVGFDYSINQKFLARLTSNLTISQIGSWIKKIPISSYSNEIISSKISWDSMDNCLIQSSIDSGNNWTTITKGSQIPDLIYGDINNDVYLKIIIPTEYTVQTNTQSFNGLEISLYNDLSFFSENNKFELIPKTSVTGDHSFNIQRMDQPIFFRKDNFGIKFNKNSSGSVHGYAQISPTSSTYNFYGTDFWMRFNSIDSGRINNILTLGSTGPTISIGTTGSLTFNIGNLYINGNAVANNGFVPVSGRHYHVVYDFGAAYNSSAMFLGGSVTNQHMHGSLGYISIWSSSVNSNTASSRYLNYVGNYVMQIPSTSTLTTSDSSASTKWQSNWNLDRITTACAFKLG